ncbi:MAG TPA: PGPGW domain-containing protein [Nocardioidaceae bacterium]|nr:PGPGW domain-containing protein [Nocardioidaceae bacterium]
MQTARKVFTLVAGWALVLVGTAALLLPGPGLLLLLAGLIVLSQQYVWAARRVEPMKARAFDAAEQGVRTGPRIAASVASACAVMGAGVVWGLDPTIGTWGPIGPRLPFGGWATGLSLILSGLIALALIGYSIRRFRGR